MTTTPVSYSRRFFQEEEIIISSCNHCFCTVAESDDDAVLEALEQMHSCTGELNLSSLEQSIESELFAAA